MKPTYLDYKIIKGTTAEEFSAAVLEALKAGYQPVTEGFTVSTFFGPDGKRQVSFFQAVVKTDEKSFENIRAEVDRESRLYMASVRDAMSPEGLEIMQRQAGAWLAVNNHPLPKGAADAAVAAYKAFVPGGESSAGSAGQLAATSDTPNAGDAPPPAHPYPEAPQDTAPPQAEAKADAPPVSEGVPGEGSPG